MKIFALLEALLLSLVLVSASQAKLSPPGPSRCGANLRSRKRYRNPAITQPQNHSIPRSDLASTQLPVVFPSFDPIVAKVYRYRQQRAVNLGSWFVHESWMTPSMFEHASGKRISELDIASGWGSLENARAVLEQHWSTFITQQDFDYLASIGINTVRLPIGYWTLGPSFCKGTAFESVAEVYANSWSRFLQAIQMAGRAGLGVLVDLHGAVGSQNGQPHSGISDGMTNLFNNASNIEQTINALTFLITELVYIPNVVGIQVLNEPSNHPQLYDFYTKAITAMRNTVPDAATFPLYIHDAFDIQRCTEFNKNRNDFVVQDHHSYFVFTSSDARKPAAEHILDVDSIVASNLSDASRLQAGKLIIGEWSCALTPVSLSQETNQLQARRDFCDNQLKVYTASTPGWAFWSYRTEQCNPDWCFLSAVDSSLPSTFFAHSNKTFSSSAINSADLLNHCSSACLSTGIIQRDIRRFKNRVASLPHHGHRERDMTRMSLSSDFAYSSGCQDGIKTSALFASMNYSKLGFKEQYVQDYYAGLNLDNAAGSYKEGFLKGLRCGENLIDSTV